MLDRPVGRRQRRCILRAAGIGLGAPVLVSGTGSGCKELHL